MCGARGAALSQARCLGIALGAGGVAREFCTLGERIGAAHPGTPSRVMRSATSVAPPVSPSPSRRPPPPRLCVCARACVLLSPPFMAAHRRLWVAALVATCLAAAAAATTLAPGVGASRPDASPGDGDCDVAVIGAGIGGLYTAWRLATASREAGVRPGRVCVFEASGRMGGRILTLRGKEALPKGYDGYSVDMGTCGGGACFVWGGRG